MEGKHHSFLDFHCVQWFKIVCRFIYTIIQYIWNKNFTPLVNITNKNSKNRRTLGTVIAKACNTHAHILYWVLGPKSRLHLSWPNFLQDILKTSDDISNVCVSITHTIDLDGVPGSWLLPDPTLVVSSVWEVNQQF